MKPKHILATVLAGSLLVAGCSNDEKAKDDSDSKSSSGDGDKKQELKLSAAASLTDVSKDLEKAFEKEHKDVDVTFNYGGSGSLRQQIEKGAPADVFMSANTKDVDMLEDKDKADNTYEYAKNKLVLVGDKDSDYKSVKDLKGDEKLAIGEIKSVPAGKYAEQYLKEENLYDMAKEHFVFAKDVKQVLNYVEKGNAKLGYIYKTDLYQAQKNGDSNVKEIDDADLKSPIIYKAATTSDNKAGKDFIEFLKSDEAKDILKKYQFDA
ncbi:molybdate ABC transporter substrate-binding protein [Staphylococcus auricularis]|uniref:Molybdate ABC transporter substrate-binding protein n=1 Tax=Staphylococcus auricularis TaxID=29379 RepID=A0ABX5III3_9STAP|nr:molybdate ABC transporter substrate-binding protein [Staphylococcus auricularis]MCE5038652.1 molybdate ABC transporter substrate-binding protein [Staphylococcus auricularis]MEB6570107.1 molybdate ABC transporter substrate-binding protein [Staphylococcus auricularis]PTH19355.1 molybdate ABC transporter substrate-binding protein [Staphylococcus auricularis]PTH25820.1 molybdate ABC transporter substrate-binding protein [Staphylococcus auricularis]